MLGLIERLAIRHANTTSIPRRTAMTTAFVANAFSQSIGLALLTGAAVRLRAYARRGADAPAVARISDVVTENGEHGASAICTMAPSPR